MPDAIRQAAQAGVDAFIVADLGVLDACKTYAPDIDVHMSTQTGITNYAAATACCKMGAKRVVLARELSLTEIAVIRDKTPPELELEAFVHGAMCMSVSGRCLLSNYLAGPGRQPRPVVPSPCRWKYYLTEETRPGQLYEIGEGEGGSYILNANDLCTAPFLDLLCKAGVDSLKIEGRPRLFTMWPASRRPTARPWTSTWPTPMRRMIVAAGGGGAGGADPHQPPALFPGVLFRTRQGPPEYIHRGLYPPVGVCGRRVDSWGKRGGQLPAAGQVVLGDTLEALTPDGTSIPLQPEWIQNEGRGTGHVHAPMPWSATPSPPLRCRP